MVVSRIAPTPSGYLHAGNAVNFLLTSWYVRSHGGKLILRIDDMDATRCRDAYVDDVFFALEWLGITIDEGPSGTGDFFRNFSLARKRDYYRGELEKLRRGCDRLYACECSRKRIEEAAQSGIYPGWCRDRALEWEPGRCAVRIDVPQGTPVAFDERTVMLDAEMGDFVLWRKDDLPAYQFASVIEDRDLGVNALVRGEDLLLSSAAQRYLAPMCGADAFAAARFIHHALLLGNDARKLSKSEGAHAIRRMRGCSKEREALFETARALAAQAGIDAVEPE